MLLLKLGYETKSILVSKRVALISKRRRRRERKKKKEERERE